MVRTIYNSCLLVLLLSIPFSGYLIADEKSEFNAALQKELGVTDVKPAADPEKKSKSEAPAAGTEAEVNPVAERYAPEKEEPSVLWLLVKVVLVLGILVAVMFYALKFISVQRDAKYPVKGVMSLLSSLPIGPNKQLQIVDISGQLFVLGISDNSINLITEIKSADVRNRIYHLRETHEPSEENFMVSLLNSIRKVHSGPVSEGAKESPSFTEIRKKQQDRLSRLKEEKESLEREMNPGFFRET